MSLSFEYIIDNIRESLSESDGHYTAEVHNRICAIYVRYDEENECFEEETKDEDK